MSDKFYYKTLRLIKPDFDSSLMDLILSLDHLRKLKLSGTTHPLIFFQIKSIFHMLESIGSARIEGNNTTISEYIEAMLQSESEVDESENILEIKNLEKAMDYVEDHVADRSISESFIRDLHSLIVDGLNREGDKTPGEYRTWDVKINKSEHEPPNHVQVKVLMTELVDFINQESAPKYDLLKVALVHHRFMWIHPFGNGNGRVGRLLTYAMLLSSGFKLNQGLRIINPTAIFCSNRDMYNQLLGEADKGDDESLEQWCHYVLSGLFSEMEKLNQLLDYTYLSKYILKPALEHAFEYKVITDKENAILQKAITVKNQLLQSKDLKDLKIFKGKQSAEISRQIKKLIDKGMLIPEKENSRKYLISFSNNYLLRGFMVKLRENEFLPIND